MAVGFAEPTGDEHNVDLSKRSSGVSRLLVAICHLLQFEQIKTSVLSTQFGQRDNHGGRQESPTSPHSGARTKKATHRLST